MKVTKYLGIRLFRSAHPVKGAVYYISRLSSAQVRNGERWVISDWLGGWEPPPRLALIVGVAAEAVSVGVDNAFALLWADSSFADCFFGEASEAFFEVFRVVFDVA